MSYQKAFLSALACVSLFSLAACTSANTDVVDKDKASAAVETEKTTTDYIKPGASIRFSHNYDGRTEPGEIENFQVFVKGGSLNGTVDVKMENNDGLKMYSDIARQKFDLSEGVSDDLDHTMNISVGAQNPGRYYLKFIATSDSGNGEPMFRAYAIAIQVGDQPYIPELGKGMTLEETPTGEKIISMEASETVEN